MKASDEKLMEVRQWAMEQAMAKHHMVSPEKIGNVVFVAKQIEDYVFAPPTETEQEKRLAKWAADLMQPNGVAGGNDWMAGRIRQSLVKAGLLKKDSL